MSAYFTTGQEKLIDKVRLYQEEITAVDLQSSPCPLLAMQIKELLVLVNRLGVNAQELLESLKDQS